MSEVVAEIVRSGFVEGHHYGVAVTLGPDGEIERTIGDPAAQILPRSANKPLQALAMLGLGLDTVLADALGGAPDARAAVRGRRPDADALGGAPDARAAVRGRRSDALAEAEAEAPGRTPGRDAGARDGRRPGAGRGALGRATPDRGAGEPTGEGMAAPGLARAGRGESGLSAGAGGDRGADAVVDVSGARGDGDGVLGVGSGGGAENWRRLLAIACASHSGEEAHLATVRDLLGAAGLSEQALGNIVDWPLDLAVRDDWVRAGREPSRIAQNCSGKHAAMLATCAARDWPLSGYFEEDHPLQLGIRQGFERVTGERAAVTVDGCGAPLLSVSLVGLARAYRSLALAGDGDEWKVATAIRSFPELVSGTRRDEFRLLTALPGAIGKFGAEAVYVVALRDGRTAALKIDDGGDRARPVVMAALLRSLGVESDEVDAIGAFVLTGGGVPVGEIRAVF